MLIDKAEIRSLIPHAGAMCLLDAVTAWDEQSITCLSDTHRDPANPLRRQGRLSVLHAIEYGAQAAAIHGALCARAAGQTASPSWSVDPAAPLRCAASLLAATWTQLARRAAFRRATCWRRRTRRSSSEVPPQTPESWLVIMANSRHGAFDEQVSHTALACCLLYTSIG